VPVLSLPAILPILLEKTPTEVAVIAKQAEDVVFGVTTSISALNQSASFSMEDAGIIADACRQIRALRAADPDVTAAALPAPALAHTLRRNRQTLLGP